MNIPSWECLLDEHETDFRYTAHWNGTPVYVKVVMTDVDDSFKRLLSRLHHPNIVNFLGYIDIHGAFVSEYCGGGNLEQYIRRRRPSVRKRLKICMDVLRALVYLHNLGVVHGGLDASQILLTRSGTAKLTYYKIRDGRDTQKDVAAAIALFRQILPRRYATVVGQTAQEILREFDNLLGSSSSCFFRFRRYKMKHNSPTLTKNATEN
jgi:serine/threonine protein kinase